jgi:hypothetical protein
MITTLIITNPVEHTKQHRPSILIKNQVQDNGQMRLVILNRNPSKLMHSNAKWLIKLLGQKHKDTLAFNQSSDVAQSSSSSCSPKLSNNVPSTRINHRAQAYKANAQVQLRTIHQSKEQLLKERTKG